MYLIKLWRFFVFGFLFVVSSCIYLFMRFLSSFIHTFQATSWGWFECVWKIFRFMYLDHLVSKFIFDIWANHINESIYYHLICVFFLFVKGTSSSHPSLFNTVSLIWFPFPHARCPLPSASASPHPPPNFLPALYSLLFLILSPSYFLLFFFLISNF